jgi:DnaJ-class molecular chaperone
VTPKAEPAEIRAAYRALMRIYHPDADRSSEAADRARQINAAYSVLNNPERRASYDDSLVEHRRIRFEPLAAQVVMGPQRFPYGAAG